MSLGSTITPPIAGGGSGTAGSTCTSCPLKDCVVSIQARVPGTRGKRNHANKRPDKTFPPSKSPDETLAGNKPAILVRGCNYVRLTATTTPPGKPVNWEVKPNENTEAAPTITPTVGTKAILKTDKTGSFSVIATLGSCKVVWNVVFVSVKILPKTSIVRKRKNKYAFTGVDRWGRSNFTSGGFTRGQYAMESSVKMTLTGGGTDGKLGVGKIKVHILQNGTADTLQGHYAGGGVMSETLASGFPVVDSNDNSPAPPPPPPPPFNPFVYWGDTVSYATFPAIGKSFGSIPINSATTDADVNRRVWTGDAPGGGFPVVKAGNALQSISGVNKFKTAVATTSDDAPDAIVVHAYINWTADFAGTIGAAPTYTYTPTSAATTGSSVFHLISESTGGQDAYDAGYEVFYPIFRDVTVV